MAETVGALIITYAAAAADVGIYGTEILLSTTIAGVSLSTAVGTAAILATTIGINYALATRPSLPTPESGSQPLKQSIPPRIRGYGINRLAGYYMLFEAALVPAISFDVIAFHSGRVGNIQQIYLHDDPIVLDSDVSLGGQATVLNTYADERYGNFVRVETKTGAEDQTAITLFAPFGVMDALWTSAHRGRGIACLGMWCDGSDNVPNFTKKFPHQLPLPSVVARCSPVWDPRDGGQSRFDESTWQVSYNPVIQLIDYITRIDGGMGLDFDTVILPNLLAWQAEADLCDEQVLIDPSAGDGLMEARYESHGWFSFDNKPEDVIGAMTATCDGWLAESGDGTLSIVVGVYREPTDPPLTENHILGFALNYGQADETTVNQLDVTYTSPANKFVQVPTLSWRDEDSIAATGAVRNQPLDLKWVHSGSQAQRLGFRAGDRLSAAMTGSFTTTLYGLRLLGKRWIKLQYPFVSGLQDCVVEIQNAEVDLLGGRISWDFIRIAPDSIEAYVPNDDGSTVPPGLPENAYVREDLTLLAREDGSNYARENA